MVGRLTQMAKNAKKTSQKSKKIKLSSSERQQNIVIQAKFITIIYSLNVKLTSATFNNASTKYIINQVDNTCLVFTIIML